MHVFILRHEATAVAGSSVSDAKSEVQLRIEVWQEGHPLQLTEFAVLISSIIDKCVIIVISIQALHSHAS